MKILLYHNATAAIAPGEGAIFATNSGWNDFGYCFDACLRIEVKGLISDFAIKLLPFVEDKPLGSVTAWISYLSGVHNKKEAEKNPNLKFPNFVSVFSSITSYRDLAVKLSSEEYDDVLSSIMEINHLHQKNKISLETFEAIVESEQFSTAVLRDAAAYKSFRFGFFSSNFLKPPADARLNFDYSASLKGFDTPHSVRFEHKDLNVISDRVHCLIGINGVGKTSYLNSLINGCLLKVNSSSPEGIKSFLYNSNSKTVMPDDEAGVKSNWEDIPAYSRVNVYSTDPHNTLPRKVSLHGCFDYRYFDMGLEGEGTLTRFLADILRSNELISQEDRFVLLKKIMQKVIPAAHLMIPVKPNLQNASKIVDETGKHWITIGAIRGGELRKLEIIGAIDFSRDLAFRTGAAITTPLSSGQKMYLRFATHFLTTASEGMLILIDEPETHLHPNLITEFMNLLYMVLDATRSIAIIATHSIYVVREIPSHCVNILNLDDQGKVSTNKVYLNTLGANVSSLSNAVFGDSLVQSFTDRIAKNIAESKLSLDEVIDKYKDSISMDMLVKIREMMHH